MARKQHAYHYIYKTTCSVTGKYYIGMHSTSNLEDGYMGSGKVIKRSINKYGLEKHSIEIIEYLSDRSSLKKRESELVDSTRLSDPLCMNLQTGGGGGLSTMEHSQKFHKAGGKAIGIKFKTDEAFREKISEQRSKRMTNLLLTGRIRRADQKGIKNSQFGTKWISHPTEGVKKVKAENLQSYLEIGWKVGRKYMVL